MAPHERSRDRESRLHDSNHDNTRVVYRSEITPDIRRESAQLVSHSGEQFDSDLAQKIHEWFKSGSRS